MRVKLSYSICTATPWNSKFDAVGAFTMRERKTAEEMKQERELFKTLYGKSKKPNPYKTNKYSCFTVQGDTCYFLIGSWQRLKDELDKAHEPYTIEEAFDPAVMPEPDISALEGSELRSGQAETLALLTTARTGMICCGVGYGKSFCIKMLCMVYPTLNILIVCPSGEVVKELYKDISRALPGQVGILNMDSPDVNGKRIIVSTTKSMTKIKPEQVQLLLFDEAHSAGMNQTGFDVMKFCFGRRFGFTATPTRNQGDYKYMEALFGPVLQQVTYQESQEAGSVTPISYYMLPIDKKNPRLTNLVEVETVEGTEWLGSEQVMPWHRPTGRTKKRGLPDYLKTRLFYINNYNRNDMIVDTFKRIQAECPEAQILIMVQSLEHLIRLGEKIPGCLYMHGERGSLAKYKEKKGLEHVYVEKYELDKDKAARNKYLYEQGRAKYLISTGTLKQGVNLKYLSVLIRADGAVSDIPSVQIPGRLARLSDNKPMAYLIDFTDNFCEEAHGRAIARQKEYNKQGWTEIDSLQTIINNLKETANDFAERSQKETETDQEECQRNDAEKTGNESPAF